MELETQKRLIPDVRRPRHLGAMLWILDVTVTPIITCAAYWAVHFDEKSFSAVLTDWVVILVVLIPSQYLVRRLVVAAKHLYNSRCQSGASLPQ